MATITAPVKGFTGSVIGVAFADGRAEATDDAQLAYFRRHGYAVEIPAPGVDEPLELDKLTVDQLKKLAEEHGVDVSAAKNKAEIVDAIAHAIPTVEGQPTE